MARRNCGFCRACATQPSRQHPRDAFTLLASAFGCLALAASVGAEQVIEADLLIVGQRPGCAAAVQAARLGVQHRAGERHEWLGGQFSAEGVGY